MSLFIQMPVTYTPPEATHDSWAVVGLVISKRMKSQCYDMLQTYSR